MYNLGIAAAIGLAVMFVVGFGFGSWVAAVLPAVLVAGGAIWFLTQRTSRLVEPQLAGVTALLQERKVDEAKAVLERLKREHGNWQILLAGQLDAQVGMIDYVQMKFDDALPRLESGKWRNAMALALIGCIHWRKGDKAAAFAKLDEAIEASPKEASLYAVRATLLNEAGRGPDALAGLAKGIEGLPKDEWLGSLRNQIANKQKIDTKAFPQAWFQFFPEDLLALQQSKNDEAKDQFLSQIMKGQRNPPKPPTPKAGPGGEPPKLNRQQRRNLEKER